MATPQGHVVQQLRLTSRPPATFLLAVCTPRARLDLRNRKSFGVPLPCRQLDPQSMPPKAKQP